MVDTERQFWPGRRVLITGHTGFKGSWLSLLLKALGAQVFGYALAPPTSPSLFELARLKNEIQSTEGDVRDFQLLSDCLSKNDPEIIFHMAAQSLVGQSYRDPLETYSTNVLGTVNLLEAVRQTGGKRIVVNVTSDKCYQNDDRGRFFSEDDPMGGKDPYSSSKACAELVTAAYRRSFFEVETPSSAPVALASARAGNVIGGGDWAVGRLLPDCVRAFQDGAAIALRHPAAIRPWQFVLEPLSGYLRLAYCLSQDGARFSKGWNFGPPPNDVCTVRDVVEKAIGHWGAKSAIEAAPATGDAEAMALHLDCSQARDELGWQPRTTLETGLELTINWYRQCHQGDDPLTLTNRQIEYFLALEGEKN